MCTYNSASFLVTEDCNLNCKYCFETHNKKTMTKDIARKGIDFIHSNCIENKMGNFHAMIFGGEPLLNLEIVEFILEYGTELALMTNVKFSATLVTNGTIMNDDVKRIINKFKYVMNTQVSIDGVKESHDMYRVTKDGSGSFDLVEKNLPDFIELYKENPTNFSIHGCLNNKTLKYLYENYIYFKNKYGNIKQWYMPIHSEKWSSEDVSLYEYELFKIARDSVDLAIKEQDNTRVFEISPLGKCNKTRFPSAPCGAGKTLCTVTAEGYLYPCHQFYFNDEYHTTRFGDLSIGWIEENRIDLFKTYDMKSLSCQKDNPNCNAYGCYICIADNWNEFGSILSTAGGVNGNRCKMSKVEKTIQDYIKFRLESANMIRRPKAEAKIVRQDDSLDLLAMGINKIIDDVSILKQSIGGSQNG